MGTACAGAVAAILMFGLPGGQNPQSQPTIDLQTVPESSPVAPPTYEGEQLQWYGSAAPGQWPDPSVGKASAQAAIRSMDLRLAKVDYRGLSLPDFSSETSALAIRPSDFDSGDAWLDRRGQSANHRLELYAWRGPEFPQKPGRALVRRWVQVVALYDVDIKRVVRLCATIAGEAIE